MNNDNLKGTAKKIEGAVESAYGSFTNDRSVQAKGEANKLAGSAQDVAGDAEDKVLSLAGRVRGFIDSASEDLSHAKEKVNNEIHDKPVKSSLIALGIGFVIGALLLR